MSSENGGRFSTKTVQKTVYPRIRVYHASFQEFLAEEGMGLKPFHESGLRGGAAPHHVRNSIGV